MTTQDEHERADVAGWTDEFIGAVFPAEYQTIMARRREVARRVAVRGGQPAVEPPDRSEAGPLVPSVKLRMFGLAFSGGGIRSATFNLGLVQALAKQGLLPRIDYLSTVSGGGYVGSCLSALLNRPDADSGWTPSFPFHLESGRQEPIALRHLRSNSNPLVSDLAGGVLAGIGLVLRGMLVNILAMVPLVVLLVGLTQLAYGEHLTGGLRAGLPWYALTGAALAVFGVAVLLFPLLAWIVKGSRRAGEIGARRRVGVGYAVLLELVLVLAVVESLPLLLRWYHQGTDAMALLQSLTGLSVVGSVLPRSRSDGKPGLIDKLLGLLTMAAVVAAAPLLLLLGYAVLAEWVVFPGTAPLDHALVAPAVYGAGVVVLVYLALFLDANSTSMYQYYRDRLSHAYLFQVDPRDASQVRPVDALRLSELNAAGTVAPYHLVNATLNLSRSRDVELRGRMADFFVFSKHYTGSIRTGYCATTELEAVDRRVNLGTALAISGAAASPMMGTSSIPPLALLMTLLNVRLGYWLPNPRRVAAGRGRGLGVGAGLRQLLGEATSRSDEHGPHVSVTDGAHIENLGVYELLRRRCKVIVVGDGEADPHMTFQGLSTVIRCAATDMGIHIDIDLGGLSLDARGRSKQHHAIGRIDYGDGEVGWMLYVKLSLGVRELPYIEQYRSANPEFPHQSTADQFFDEAQLEAYRALGFKVGLRTLQALAELREAAGEDEDELLDFSAGAGGAAAPATQASEDPLEAGLYRSFHPAADAEPPW